MERRGSGYHHGVVVASPIGTPVSKQMSSIPPHLKPVPYSAVRSRLSVGSILLCRPASLTGRLITRVTNSAYSHASMIGPAGTSPHGVLMIGETREHKDARLIALSQEIRTWPGLYDVYAVNGKWNPAAAWAFVCRAAGAKYGWRHLSRTWLRLRISRFIPPIRNSNSPEWPRACSALVHAALRAGGGPQLKPYDSDVVPGDLADPSYFRYTCTLVCSWNQVDAFLKEDSR